MRYFYDLIFALYAFVYLPILIWKGKFDRHLLERCGIFEREALGWCASHDKTVWVHAVSVGEVVAARPLVEKLKKEFPACGIVISTTTKAGNRLAKDVVFKRHTPEPGAEVLVIYLPLDSSGIVRRVVDVVKPAFFGMMETELWPNLILALSEKGVPIVLLNGRISDKSYPWYRAASFFMRPALARIDRFCMQSELDAQRIRSIGADPGKVRLTGNVKFDNLVIVPPGPSRDTGEAVAALRATLGIGPDEDVIVAGSTHSPEEEVLIALYKNLLARFSQVRLLLAPRHIERSVRVESLVRKHGFIPARISRMKNVSAPARAAGRDAAQGERPPVLILDTVGQLKDIYACATVVFMGGSLMRKGGHNLIEPAVHGRPILFGPYMSNFRDMADLFIRYGAAMKVEDRGALERALWSLLNSPEDRERMGKNARELVRTNAGAAERTMDAIREVLHH